MSLAAPSLFSFDMNGVAANAEEHHANCHLSRRCWRPRGDVVEVFRVPLDSCLVHLDDDPRREREWFFYREEVTVAAEDTLDQFTSRK
jgi:hypothetical protein